MATQRLTVITVGGEAGKAIANQFARWGAVADSIVRRHQIDDLAERLRENSASLPIRHFCEWIDRWSMGDVLPEGQKLLGERFEMACFSSPEALAWAAQSGAQFAEQQWFATCLREAAGAWGALVTEGVVLVLRQILGASTTDEEVLNSLRNVPGWLN